MAKAKAKSDQLERFRKMAEEVAADERPGALGRAFGKLDPKKRVVKTAKSK